MKISRKDSHLQGDKPEVEVIKCAGEFPRQRRLGIVDLGLKCVNKLDFVLLIFSIRSDMFI